MYFYSNSTNLSYKCVDHWKNYVFPTNRLMSSLGVISLFTSDLLIFHAVILKGCSPITLLLSISYTIKFLPSFAYLRIVYFCRQFLQASEGNNAVLPLIGLSECKRNTVY